MPTRVVLAMDGGYGCRTEYPRRYKEVMKLIIGRELLK